VDSGAANDTTATADAAMQPSAIDAGTWVNISGNLAGMHSECGNMSMLSVRPDRDELISGIALNGLWSNTDPEEPTWRHLGEGNGSAVITNRTSTLVYDPENHNVFWESGAYGAGGGVYQTIDGGQTFVQLGKISHNDGLSVDFTDSKRRVMLVAGHEQTNKLYRSTDSGINWTDIGTALPTEAGFLSSPLVLDSKIHLLGTSHGARAGVYRTNDGGESWQQVYQGAIRDRPMLAADHSVYWLLDMDAGLIRSTDDGSTWVQATGPGILSTYSGAGLIELPNRSLVSLGFQSLMISDNHAATWRRLGPPPPFMPAGLAYSAFRKTLLIWHFDCHFDGDDPVLSDAVVSWAFDYQAE
jgi:photosystem II stability/assembly factor-like uncharacterized protein